MKDKIWQRERANELVKYRMGCKLDVGAREGHLRWVVKRLDTGHAERLSQRASGPDRERRLQAIRDPKSQAYTPQ